MPTWRSIHGAGITMPSARIRASVGRHRWLSRQPGSVGARNGTGRARDLRASRPVPLRRAPKTNSITQRLWFPMDESRGACQRACPGAELHWRCATPDCAGQPQGRLVNAKWYEPGLNPTYQDFATHYGTAILPARPRKPRDKVKVEVGVQVVERWILARLRNQMFFSLI